MRQSFRWFGPDDSVKLSYIKQAGASHVVTALHHINNGDIWTVNEIKQRKKVIEANGWDNHEDTFEETIRRELLAAQQTIYILKEDNKELTKAYYLLLKENERLKKLH